MTIYTDGGCNPNPGPGAWAWAIDKDTFESGSEERTTNNRMEMMAVIKAVEYVRVQGFESVATIYSDSKYVVNGFMSWMYGWQSRGWNKPGGPIKNLELWKILWENRNKVVLKWVRGHNGNEMNEFVDGLCNKAMGTPRVFPTIPDETSLRERQTMTIGEFHRIITTPDLDSGKEVHLKHLWDKNNAKSIFEITGLDVSGMMRGLSQSSGIEINEIPIPHFTKDEIEELWNQVGVLVHKPGTLTVEGSAKILEQVLREDVNFDSDQDRTDFLLDVVSAYRKKALEITGGIEEIKPLKDEDN